VWAESNPRIRRPPQSTVAVPSPIRSWVAPQRCPLPYGGANIAKKLEKVQILRIEFFKVDSFLTQNGGFGCKYASKNVFA
jgi:hypothetical protein